MKERDFLTISGRIKGIILAKSDLDEIEKEELADQITEIEKNYGYKPPELVYVSWCQLANFLNQNFNPENSDWEKEIQAIFNNQM